MSVLPRGLDMVLGVLALVAAGYLVFRPRLPGRQDLIGTGLVPDLFLGMLGGALVLVLATLPHWRGRRSRWILRAGAWVGVIVLVGMAATRLALARHEAHSEALWPPRLSLAERATVATLPPIDRAEWALRLALHAAGTATTLDRPPPIPGPWPWPDDVLLAVRTTELGTELWTAVPGTGATCHALVEANTGTLPDDALVPACSPDAQPPARLTFAVADRSAAVSGRPAAPPTGSGWPQHRRDAARTGVVPPEDSGDPDAQGWRAALHTPVRASASAVDGHVLVGGHASGLVASLDLETGAEEWVTHAPNWVHQEPVSDGGVVVVGFGDNDRSFRGTAPSGVAAFDLATGASIWTAFDESSVMTSPILADSVVLYATAAGLLKTRDRATGVLRSAVTMPGGVIMGPPLLHRDTVVAALDINTVCAYLLSTSRELWCRELPWLQMVGHSSPMIANGEVLLSAVATARTIGLDDLGSVDLSQLPTLVRAVLFPLYWEPVHAGNVYLALDLATGEPIWRGPLFGMHRVVDGHTAGTPARSGTVGLVVLPVADTLVAFDIASGQLRWSAAAHAGRGPPLIAGDLAIVTGRDGVIEVRTMADGALVCTIRRSVGWDRAGPILADEMLVMVDLTGVVEAIPMRDVRRCSSPMRDAGSS